VLMYWCRWLCCVMLNIVYCLLIVFATLGIIAIVWQAMH